MSDQAETWFGLPRRAKPLVQAGILLDLGLGGFFDGIVLHQILQWHHMASAVTDTTTVSGLPIPSHHCTTEVLSGVSRKTSELSQQNGSTIRVTNQSRHSQFTIH
jgi:hypothetical protein